MKEKQTVFDVDGKEYKAVFNLNVMQEIQIEYGTIEKWGELTDGYESDEEGKKIPLLDEKGNVITKKIIIGDKETEIISYKTKEVDITALIFGIKAMLNEAIDIDNEENNTNQPFLTDKQVGRIITKIGLQNVTEKMNQAVIDSTSSDEPKNE